MNTTPTPWRISGGQGILNSVGVSAEVNLTNPALGIQHIKFAGQSLDMTPLKLTPHPPSTDGEQLGEAYVRATDLIASYAQTPPRTAHPQVYWRLLSRDDARGIELIVSMQTSLLDSNPRLHIVSAYPPAELLQARVDGSFSTDDVGNGDSPGLFLVRPSNADYSYSEMVFPSDFLGATVTSDVNGLQLSYELFPEDLEKGVIRKGRVRAIWLPRQNDEAIAWSIYRELVAQGPPLTV